MLVSSLFSGKFDLGVPRFSLLCSCFVWGRGGLVCVMLCFLVKKEKEKWVHLKWP